MPTRPNGYPAFAIVALVPVALAALAGPARADQDYIKVQPIQVCDSAGANCATVTLNETLTQQIYNQAGIAIQWAPVVQYDAPSSAVTFQAGLGLTTTVQGLGGDATDQAHLLLRGYQEPPNPVPADPQVLNLFYVGAIERSDGGPINGLGLIGGNGMIVGDVSTGLGSQTGVPVDVAAHEIGHNLGLRDSDLANPGVTVAPTDLPFNLMNSLSRITPPALPVTTNGTDGTDRLVAGQISTLQQPLFTVDGASAQLSQAGSKLTCGQSSDVCTELLSLPDSSTTQTLVGLKLRYLSDAPVNGFVEQFGNNACNGSYTGEGMLASGGFETDFTFGTGCTPDQQALIGTDFETGSSTLPFSVEFDFSGGTTSTAVYSASGVADSTMDATYAINGQTAAAPGFVAPTTQILDLDYTPVSTAVPEPGAALLMLTGLVGLAVCRRPRARPWRLRPA